MQALRLLLCALVGWSFVAHSAAAQSSFPDRFGVRHVISARVAPFGPAATDRELGVSDLEITVRISDHAREAQFFGEVMVAWPEFVASMGTGEQDVWTDPQCHQRRGLPKATIVAIDGMVETARSRFPVSARPRRIGLKLPEDEIRQAQPRPGGRDETGSYLAFRTETAQSHVPVLVKIHVIDCVLK